MQGPGYVAAADDNNNEEDDDDSCLDLSLRSMKGRPPDLSPSYSCIRRPPRSVIVNPYAPPHAHRQLPPQSPYNAFHRLPPQRLSHSPSVASHRSPIEPLSPLAFAALKVSPVGVQTAISTSYANEALVSSASCLPATPPQTSTFAFKTSPPATTLGSFVGALQQHPASSQGYERESQLSQSSHFHGQLRQLHQTPTSSHAQSQNADAVETSTSRSPSLELRQVTPPLEPAPHPLRRQQSAPSFDDATADDDDGDVGDNGRDVGVESSSADSTTAASHSQTRRAFSRSLSDSASRFASVANFRAERSQRNGDSATCKQRLKSSAEKRLKCDRCGKTFASSSGLKKHIESKHYGIR